ncbi:MAG: ArsR family transcriptional regulator [Candidatus Woesearchaeota archaeon]
MWYKKYGWKSNPFVVKYSTDLVGFDNEKRMLMDFVDSGDACLVTGVSGVGKTSLLKWIEKSLKRYKIKYLNVEGISEFFSLQRYVGRKGIFRDKVLLIDEAHYADETLRKEMKMLWDNNILKSVIIAQTPDNMHVYADSFKNRIGNRQIRLSGVDIETAKGLISIRTENNHPFDDSIIRLIVDEAKNIPRKILEHCEMVCIELQDSDINPENVRMVLKEKRASQLAEIADLQEPLLPDNLMPIVNKKLKGYSPMQQRLILILIEGNRTAKQLSKILNSSEGSVGKQLSKLVDSRVVSIINHRRPKVYGLTSDFKADLQ